MNSHKGWKCPGVPGCSMTNDQASDGCVFLSTTGVPTPNYIDKWKGRVPGTQDCICPIPAEEVQNMILKECSRALS